MCLSKHSTVWYISGCLNTLGRIVTDWEALLQILRLQFLLSLKNWSVGMLLIHYSDSCLLLTVYLYSAGYKKWWIVEYR